MVGATNMATIITTNGNANPNVNGSINAHTVVTVPTSMRSAGSDQQQDQGTFDDFDELGDNTGQDQGDSGGAYGMW